MRKFLLLVFLFLLAVSSAMAQTSATGRVGVGVAADRPEDCNAGDQWNSTDTHISSLCGPADTWVNMQGGGGQPFVGPSPYTETAAAGAACDNSTDDSTITNTTINGLAAGGGTAALCADSRITPPANFTAPTKWVTIGLMGPLNVTSTLNIRPNQYLKCMDPTINTRVIFFGYRPACEIAPTSTFNAPTLHLANGTGDGAIGMANIFASTAGAAYAIESDANQVYWDHVYAAGATPNVSSGIRTGGFGQYFHRGEFYTAATSAADCVNARSALFQNAGQMVLNSTFIAGCGMHFESLPFFNGVVAMLDKSSNQLSENNVECMFCFHLGDTALGTDGVVNGFIIENAQQADPYVDTPNAPLIGVTRVSGSGTVQNVEIVNSDITGGSYFELPAGNNPYVQGAFIRGNLAGHATGLYGGNSYAYLDRGEMLLCGFFCNTPSAAAGGFTIPLFPDTLTATPSGSGGTIAAGAYYYMLAAVDQDGNEGLLSYEVPVTLTGSTSSVGFTWACTNTSAADYHIFRMTGRAGWGSTAWTRYTLGSAGCAFTDTGAAGTSVAPTQIKPTISALGAAIKMVNYPAPKLTVHGVIETTNLAYNATTWNGSLDVPTRDDVRDKIESLSIPAAPSDTAYNAGTWDGVTTIAPSKNAVRDKIEAMTPSDTAYDATTWNANTDAATKNAIRDKIETLSGAEPGTTIGDTRYCSTTATPCVESRLAIGTTGQYYSVVGGLPAWVTPGAVPNHNKTCSGYTVLQADLGNPIFCVDAGAAAVTLNSPASYSTNFFFCLTADAAGTITVTASGNVRGAGTLAVAGGGHNSACFMNNGTTWDVKTSLGF